MSTAFGADPLRIAVGNEASDRDIEEFGRRFGCEVWDSFGSTENAVIIIREPGTPKGSLGQGYPGVAVYNPQTVTECPPAQFDAHGALINGDEAVGELVNTSQSGYFSGYYNAEAVTADRLRHGIYWSGDLAYRDAEGWIYLAGRVGDWVRVDGENMAALVLNHGATLTPGRLRVVPRRPTRPVSEGVAALCPHRRRPTDYGDAQGAQARPRRPGPDPRRR
jgi:acyl-coenzyme A synthetase/AMP-(fatty) acid ligase